MMNPCVVLKISCLMRIRVRTKSKNNGKIIKISTLHYEISYILDAIKVNIILY